MIIELNQTRDVIQLLGATICLWRRYFGLFFALTLLVVAPVLLLVDGLWSGTLDDFTAPRSTGAEITSGVLGWVVQPALVTAIHVAAVMDAGRGVTPKIGRSLRVALRVFLPVALVLVLYVLAAALGLVLLVLPGIYVMVRLYFGAQAVVAEGRGGVDALRRSWELVGGQWWRAFGIALLVGVITAAMGIPFWIVERILGELGADTGPFVAVAQILWDTLGLSFGALAATLFFFDLRFRAGSGEAPSSAVPPRAEAQAGL